MSIGQALTIIIKKAISEQQPASPTPAAEKKVLVVRLPAKDSEEEFCKCGYPGCLGHEVIDKDAVFPGITSEVVLAKMIQSGVKLTRYLQEVSHIEHGPPFTS